MCSLTWAVAHDPSVTAPQLKVEGPDSLMCDRPSKGFPQHLRGLSNSPFQTGWAKP